MSKLPFRGSFHGETSQNVPSLLLTESGCWAGRESGGFKEA